jgi:uncharacterized protein involved in exopolysaccharide biosynthesis
LKTKGDSLKEFKKQIKNQEKFIVVSKAITEEALWQREAAGGGLEELGDRRLRSEEINPIYQDLRARIVNTEIELNTLRLRLEHLKNSIELTIGEIDELEKIINQREFELTQLTREATIHKIAYDNLALRLEEARITKAMELGEVRIVSPAAEPEGPIRPRKGLMVAISSILSLMFGTFLAFFIEYWQSSKKETYCSPHRS